MRFTGRGKCGVAVVRLSGNRSLEALKRMTNILKLVPRTAFLRKIRDPETGEVIDNGLCLWFPGRHDFNMTFKSSKQECALSH